MHRRSLTTATATAMLIVAAALPATAGDVVPSVTTRFQATTGVQATTGEVPDFQRHVVPLLGRLGCNGRACHGSFQGQGGFQLSLFGYDFENDHRQIVDDDFSRLDRDVAADSMLLTKPTMIDEHGGGKRLDVGTWQYNLLLRWIEEGAAGRDDEPQRLVRLAVTPAEVIPDSEGERTPLQAVAEWSDGTREDVTALCRFQSNDPAVAEVDELGVVTSGRPGDTHVVVFYDSAVVPVTVLRPVNDHHGDDYPAVAASTPVDEHIVAKLSKLGIVPSDRCSDEEFLRRVSLDMTGTLPPAWEVEAFLRNDSPDKRDRKIEELLASPAYAAWWTTRLCDWTGNNPDFANQFELGREQFSRDWYDWIERRVAENVPYDEIVAGIVLSASRDEGESYRDYCENMVDVYAKDADASFADRDTLPHYWARNNFRKAEDRAIGFAYSFLGIRIQCAQCHKHPFDQWTQNDFKSFEAFFTRVNYGNGQDSRDDYRRMLDELDTGEKQGAKLRNELGKMLRDGNVIPLREVYVVEPRPAARRNRKVRPKDKPNNNQNAPAAEGRVLGGETVALNEYADARTPLVEWLRSPDNPYFAKAFVNRVWSSYFGTGIVEPADDLSLANPPSNAPLLQYLADGFVASGYDMKWVHREIVRSDAYQRSWRPNETNAGDDRNFSRAQPRRLPAEAAYDAIALATSSDAIVREMLNDPSQRAIGIAGSGGRYKARIDRKDADFALTVFGRSIRESNCDCDRSNDASLLQTVYLRNDGDVLEQIDGSNDAWLSGLAPLLGGDKSPAADARERLETSKTRLRDARTRITRMTAQAAQLRKQGRNDDAKQLVARIKRLREQIQNAERTVRKQQGDVDRRQADDGAAPVDLPESPAEFVEQAYLRTLSRYPTDDEIDEALAYLKSAESLRTGARDLVWALLNTKEFILNH